MTRNVTQMWQKFSQSGSSGTFMMQMCTKIQPIRKQWHFRDTDVTYNFSTGKEWNQINVTKVPLLPDWLNFCTHLHHKSATAS
ncbi:hypothetical protein V9T40_012223 [Parthenolecanium corni]|uniref:Uncharacterized protein n=1 Tax=Parthenolecanium corni TaxID=536013 RepID=A0AAN9TK11_9HEMI